MTQEEVRTQLPEIKMEGRSGCRLHVVREDGHVIIRKYSCALEYNNRLLNQALKQQKYYDSLSSSHSFSTARVIDIYYSDNDLGWFSMPYLFSEKYSDYLEKANIVVLKKLLNDLLHFFATNIDQAKVDFVEDFVITTKIADLKQKVHNSPCISNYNYFSSVLEYLSKNIPSTPLPLGFCHGDFTFSNILFSDDKIYLLDFLDSFIESPIIDIVKLRQDTCFNWSIMLEKGMPLHKKNKLIQTFNYFDREIALFCTNQQLDHWYKYLQVFNLIRIVPYLTDRDELLFIEKSLRQILA